MVKSADRRVRLRRRQDTEISKLRRHVNVAIAVLVISGCSAFAMQQNSRAAACHALNARIAGIGESVRRIVNGAPAQQRAAANRQLAPLYASTTPVSCPATVPLVP